MEITKNSLIGDILDFDRGTAQFFLAMRCTVWLPSARNETIEQACFVHGTNPDELVKNINDYLAKND